MHSRIWDDSGKHLFEISNSQTPEFVKDRLRSSILSGVLFSDIESIASGQRDELQSFMLDTLTDDGWTIDDLSDQIEQLGVSPSRADLIARTETAAVVNSAREEGYKEKGQGDDLFYWTGDIDNRTTKACEWLINKTNPFEGGDPVSMDELKELIEEAPTHDPDLPDNIARPDAFVVHPNERKTFARAPVGDFGTAE
jgi:hypothetical protein